MTIRSGHIPLTRASYNHPDTGRTRHKPTPKPVKTTTLIPSELKAIRSIKELLGQAYSAQDRILSQAALKAASYRLESLTKRF